MMTSKPNDVVPPLDFEDAFDFISETLDKDSDHAWAWHCNIACCMQDEGVGYRVANLGAARVMKCIFGIDVTQFDEWKNFVEGSPRWNEDFSLPKVDYRGMETIVLPWPGPKGKKS